MVRLSPGEIIFIFNRCNSESHSSDALLKLNFSPKITFSSCWDMSTTTTIFWWASRNTIKIAPWFFLSISAPNLLTYYFRCTRGSISIANISLLPFFLLSFLSCVAIYFFTFFPSSFSHLFSCFKMWEHLYNDLLFQSFPHIPLLNRSRHTVMVTPASWFRISMASELAAGQMDGPDGK